MAKVLSEEGRLEELRRAHRPKPKARSARAEDYLELVYELEREKGYARLVDIAGILHVSPPTVSKMLKRLEAHRLITYERYRGIRLTEKGARVARSLRERHSTLVRFFMLLGLDKAKAHATVEGVEHYLNEEALKRIKALTRFLERSSEVLT
jgi:Mn-dependent DtxR family transcriptional regulator